MLLQADSVYFRVVLILWGSGLAQLCKIKIFKTGWSFWACKLWKMHIHKKICLWKQFECPLTGCVFTCADTQEEASLDMGELRKFELNVKIYTNSANVFWHGGQQERGRYRICLFSWSTSSELNNDANYLLNAKYLEEANIQWGPREAAAL